MNEVLNSSTISDIQRQNVLNNKYAVQKIESEMALGGIVFQNIHCFTKAQVAAIFDVDMRTIDRYISKHSDELGRNGYLIIKGRSLREFKDIIDVDDTNVVDIDPKIPQLGIFNFKAILNLAMLLAESEKARSIRARILDIVIEVISHRAGEITYINQRDYDYLPAAFQEDNYRKTFTNALEKYIEIKHRAQYGKYTNLIYQAIFAENAKEYRQILNLQSKDKTRDTFYAEILDLIAAFEAGFAEQLEEKFTQLNRKLFVSEANKLFTAFACQATFKPLINKARTLMASRDFNLRDALHDRLQHYIQAMPEADYERFLGEKSKALEDRIKESISVYKRLRDR